MTQAADNSFKKPALTHEQLIDKLEKRDLLIPNKQTAIGFLQRVNYYRFSAYFLSLYKEKDVFKDGITFDHVSQLYEFDMKLRNLLMEQLERIEIGFRAHIAYELGHKYGPLGYQHSEHFTDEQKHKEFMDKLQGSIQESKKELFVVHHQNKYKGQFPVWVAVELISFGPLSKLFSNMKSDDKESISQTIYGLPNEYVESWLRTLSNIRNVCAHYARLYNKMIAFRPKLNRADLRAARSNERVFAAILVMGKLTTDKDQWGNFVTRLEALMYQYAEVVGMDRIGFPHNWDTVLRNA